MFKKIRCPECKGIVRVTSHDVTIPPHERRQSYSQDTSRKRRCSGSEWLIEKEDFVSTAFRGS